MPQSEHVHQRALRLLANSRRLQSVRKDTKARVSVRVVTSQMLSVLHDHEHMLLSASATDAMHQTRPKQIDGKPFHKLNA